MVTWQTALVIVLAVVAGALLPALVQLSLTLRRSRIVLEETSVRLGRALDAVSASAERLDRIAVGLERTVEQVRQSVRIASAVGAAVAPSVAAAVQAWHAGAAQRRGGPPSQGNGAVPAEENGEEELA